MLQVPSNWAAIASGTEQIIAKAAVKAKAHPRFLIIMLPATTIDLGSEARLPGDYAAGHALGMTYEFHKLPDENVLQSDLQTAIRAYRALTFRGGFELTNDEDISPDDTGAHSLLERRQYRLHRRIEKNAAAARMVKQHHGTRCQACGLDFAERYGPIPRIHRGASPSTNLKPDRGYGGYI